MDLKQLQSKLINKLKNDDFIQGTISQPRRRSNELKRVRLKLIELRGVLHLQFEYQYERIIEHENIQLTNIDGKVNELLEQFRQVHAQFVKESIHIQISKRFKVMWKTTKHEEKIEQNLAHDRQKKLFVSRICSPPFSCPFRSSN